MQDKGIDIIIDNNENDDDIKYCSIVQYKNGYKKGKLQWRLVIILTDMATTIENGIRGSVLCNTQYPVGMSTSVSWQVQGPKVVYRSIRLHPFYSILYVIFVM